MNFLKFLGKSLYSNKEVSYMYKKPKWYSFVIYLLTLIVLLIPIITYNLTLKYEDVGETYPNMGENLNQFLDYCKEKGKYIIIKDNKIDTNFDLPFKKVCDVSGDDYSFFVFSDYKKLPEYSISDKSNDNIIWFGHENIYVRYVLRNPDSVKKVVPYNIYGSYHNVSFDTNELINYTGEDKIKYYNDAMVKLVQQIYHSTDATRITFDYLKVLLEETLCVLIFGIILYAVNRKGKRNYDYNKPDGLFVMMSASLLPAVIASIPAYFFMHTIWVVLLAMNVFKFLLLVRVQIAPTPKFDDQTARLERVARMRLANKEQKKEE